MNQQRNPLTEVVFLVLSLIVVWLILAAPAPAQTFTLRRTFDIPSVTSDFHLFGRSVALDGNWALIGAPGDMVEVRGEAHLFDVTTGNLLWTFSDPFVNEEDWFGRSVALDGNWALIGDPNDSTHGSHVGQAHLFDITTGNLWHTFDDPTVSFIDFFGYSVAIDGEHVLIGAPHDDNRETVHLFDIAGNLLHTFDGAGTDWGWRVALDGERVLLRDIDRAHLLDLAGNLLHTFYDPTGPSDDDFFGYSVALHGDRVLIGDHYNDTNGFNVGQAHLFDTSGNLLWTFNDPTPTEDYFGGHVALDENHILIGAWGDSTHGSAVGQAHLFDATTFDLLHTFDNPTPAEHDKFGSAVALAGNRFLFGVSGDDTNGIEVGQAYLFTLSCDFNADGLTDINDIDALIMEIAAGTNDLTYDLDGNAVVDEADRDEWLAQAGALNLPSGNAFLVADFDLDGSVDGRDFIIWNANKFSPTGKWSFGDANGDGVTDGQDFIAWNQNKFQSADGMAAVPETAAGTLLLTFVISLGIVRRRP